MVVTLSLHASSKEFTISMASIFGDGSAHSPPHSAPWANDEQLHEKIWLCQTIKTGEIHFNQAAFKNSHFRVRLSECFSIYSTRAK